MCAITFNRFSKHHDEPVHDRTSRAKAHLLKNYRIGARLPERGVPWWFHATHALDQRREPRYLACRRVKLSEVDVASEHFTHDVASGDTLIRRRFDCDRKRCFVSDLRCAYDDGSRRRRERAHVLSFGRQDINNVCGQSTEHANREVEPIGHDNGYIV